MTDPGQQEAAIPDVMIVGGGLAGLAAAVALGGKGYSVRVLEARPFLGGRATSYQIPSGADQLTTIDNCQHLLLRCCRNLLDFYERLGVSSHIRFYRKLYWIEPGGRISTMQRGLLKPPLHFAGSFARLHFLNWADKVAIGLALLAVQREFGKRPGLESMTMLEWLREKKQTPDAINRFWRQVLVSAINEELDRMAASHGLQVFRLGFLAQADSYELGIPSVPLAELYAADVWRRLPAVCIEPRATVQQVRVQDGRVAGVHVSGSLLCARHYVLAVPFERIPALLPELALNLTGFEHSPITGVHLWFDRPITNLPHATLLDRTMQWMFNKGGGKHIQLVVSASRQLAAKGRNEIVDLALAELREFFPLARTAQLEKAHVVKEMRATFSAKPGLERTRPPATTGMRDLFLAGDWTRSGWPATMEGAVRSGYLAAEAIFRATGRPEHLLLPDPIAA